MAADSVHQPAINALAEAGVLEGTECGSGLFCPSQPLQRWTAAVWLVRAFDSAPASALSESRFADVDPTQWWAAHAERLADLGITKGCRQDPLRYCPTGTVTRARAASFLARALDLEDAPSAGFVDIEGSTHAGAVDALAIAKITAGCSTKPYRYCPNRPTTRAQMASLIARALGLVPLPTAADTGQDGPDEQDSAQPTTSDSDNSAPEDSAAESDDASDLIDTDPRDGILDLDGARAHKDTSGTASGYTAVSSGHSFACGLRTDGTITCWGSSHSGRTDPPAGTFSAVSVGTMHSCGIRTDGTVTCWGDNRHDQIDAPAGQFSTISAGGGHSCGIRTDGTVACWGSQPLGTGRSTHGNIQRRQRGRRALVRDPHRRHRRLLGQPTRRGLGTGRSTHGNIQRRQRGDNALVRDPHRRHHRLLGPTPGPASSLAGASECHRPQPRRPSRTTTGRAGPARR